MVASWRLKTAMSSGFTLPPRPGAVLCLRTFDGAMPCRRSSLRNTVSSGARLLPFTRLPRLSLPSQAKGMSRLIVLTLVVAAEAMNYSSFITQW